MDINKEKIFDRLSVLPDVHARAITDYEEAHHELKEGLTTSILRNMDTSLPSVVLLGGMESYLIVDALRETSLPFTTITLSPNLNVMDFYVPGADIRDKTSSSIGIVGNEVLADVGGYLEEAKTHEVHGDFKRASSINKDKTLTFTEEFKLASIIGLLRHAFIQGKQTFNAEKFNLFYGGYGEYISGFTGDDPARLNRRISDLSKKAGATHNLFSTALQSMNSIERGSLSNGMKLINPFLGYSFYRSASEIHPSAKRAVVESGEKFTLTEIWYLSAVSNIYPRATDNDYRKIIPASVDIHETLKIPESVLYEIRGHGRRKGKFF